MAKETYAAARMRLHKELGERGWEVSSPTLKEPWANVPGRRVDRIRFRPQAVYLNAHSTFIDFRGMSVEEFANRIHNEIARRQ